MKRLVPVVALFLGASVCSQAAIILSASGASVLGAGGSLINFESGSFPIGSFTSLPFNLTGSGAGTSATISAPATGAFGNSGLINNNSGTNGSIGYSATNKYLTNWNTSGNNFSGSASTMTNRLLLTFSNGLTGIEFNYSGNDSNAAANYGSESTPGTRNRVIFCTQAIVNGACPDAITSNNTAFFRNQFNGINPNQLIGWTQDNGSSATITNVLIEFNGGEANGTLATDFMVFDNFNALVAGATSGTSAGTSAGTTTGGGGAVPEPSTYALMGAGLAALAYARRKQ